MPKRKAVKLSGLIDSDDEDVMQMDATEDTAIGEQEVEEPPIKKQRGRPRSSGQGAAETKKALGKPRAGSAASTQETVPMKPAAKGRPRANKAPPEPQPEDVIETEIQTGNDDSLEMDTQNNVSNDELDSPKNVAPRKKTGKLAGTRGRKKTIPEKQISKDGEFEYTPKSTKSLKISAKAENRAKRIAGMKQQPETEENDAAAESHQLMPEADEMTLSPENPAISRSQLFSPSKYRDAGKTAQRVLQESMNRWNASRILETEKVVGDPELKRRLNDMTKRYESLESRFRTLREIGIVEANSNMEKLKKQCEATTEGMNLSTLNYTHLHLLTI